MDDFVTFDDLPIGSPFRVRGEDEVRIKVVGYPRDLAVRVGRDGITNFNHIRGDTMVEPGSIEFIPNRRSK